MPRETNETTVYNMNFDDNITFFSEEMTYLFSPHEYQVHANHSKNYN